MVPIIILNYTNSTSFKLTERAENVEITQLDYTIYINYEISNIYNPNLKFKFCVKEWKDALAFCNHITIIKKEDEN